MTSHLVDGSIASMGAALFTNPVEVVKTRLQLQGELMKEGQYKRRYNGMAHGFKVVAREEGLKALQKGLPASLVHQVCQNGIRFGVYTPLRKQSEKMFGAGLPANFTAGAAAGVVGAICGSPPFMVKIRLQAQHAQCINAVGVQHQYKGFLDATYQIAKQKGISGLFHGWKTACVRTAVGSSAQLSTYDTMKSAMVARTGLATDDTRLHLLCSAFSGVAITLAMNPFDVLITRCYNNPNHKDTVNITGAFKQILQTEGPRGLYKGASGLFLRMTPHTILTFLFLEQIRMWRYPQENCTADDEIVVVTEALD